MKFAENYLNYLVGTIFVVLVRSLHEREPVYITYVCLATRAQHIKAADFLLKCFADSSGVLFLFTRQVHRVPHFFASFLVPLNFAIDWWSFSCLSMSVLLTNCVYFYVKAIGWQELFINVRSFGPQSWFVIRWDELRTFAVGFPKQDAVAAATWTVVAVMDDNCMIFCIYRLLNEWFVQSLASNHDVVIILLNICIKVFKQCFIFICRWTST